MPNIKFKPIVTLIRSAIPALRFRSVSCLSSCYAPLHSSGRQTPVLSELTKFEVHND